MDRLASWLKGEWADEDKLRVLLVAKSDDSGIGTGESVEPEELKAFQAKFGLTGDDRTFWLDGDQESGGFATWNKFVDANPYNYTAGIPMIIDKEMKIREISGTYEWDEYPKSTIQDCIDEVD
jgi:hypothetical protein